MCRGAIACSLTDARSASSGCTPLFPPSARDKKKKDPSDRIFWVDGGTFDLRHEPRFGYKWLKRLAGLYYKIAVKNTENINTNSGIKHQIAITKNLCFCLQIFALILI